MTPSELNDTLAKLHDELAQGQQLDEEARDRLKVLLADIQSTLDRDPSTPAAEEEDDTLGDRLQDAVTRVRSGPPPIQPTDGPDCGRFEQPGDLSRWRGRSCDCEHDE